MWYVDLLESDGAAGQRYVSITSDLRRRVAEHNSGKSSHTSKSAALRRRPGVRAMSRLAKAEPDDVECDPGHGSSGKQ